MTPGCSICSLSIMRQERLEMRVFLKALRFIEHRHFLGVETEKKIGDSGRVLQEHGGACSDFQFRDTGGTERSENASDEEDTRHIHRRRALRGGIAEKAVVELHSRAKA